MKTLNPHANEFHSVNPQPAVVTSSPESSTLLQVSASGNDEAVEPSATGAEPQTPEGVQEGDMVLPETAQGDGVASMDNLEGGKCCQSSAANCVFSVTNQIKL